MRTDARVVVDTNVLVSAAIKPNSVPRQAIDHLIDSGVLLISTPLLDELLDVFARPKILRLTVASERQSFLANLIRFGEIVAIHNRIRACRGPKDNMILELAVNVRAGCIVTGDADLLGLHSFRGIAIVTPTDFLERAAGR